MSVPSRAYDLDLPRYRAAQARARLVSALTDLLSAMERRDLGGVWRVLDAASATRSIPAAVREEALVIARLPARSFRAPVRLYEFLEQLRQLGDEPLEWDDPEQLHLGMAADAGAPAWRTTAPRTR